MTLEQIENLLKKLRQTECADHHCIYSEIADDLDYALEYLRQIELARLPS